MLCNFPFAVKYLMKRYTKNENIEIYDEYNNYNGIECDLFYFYSRCMIDDEWIFTCYCMYAKHNVRLPLDGILMWTVCPRPMGCWRPHVSRPVSPINERNASVQWSEHWPVAERPNAPSRIHWVLVSWPHRSICPGSRPGNSRAIHSSVPSGRCHPPRY